VVEQVVQIVIQVLRVVLAVAVVMLLQDLRRFFLGVVVTVVDILL
jgi:hypothetical protein